MSDISKINYPVVKSYSGNLTTEKNSFTSSTYATFLTGYISQSGDDTVAKMATGLRGIYKDIKKAYEQIESWWNGYLDNLDGIENALSNDGRSGNISESVIRNFITASLEQLPEYKANFTTLQFKYKGTVDFIQQAMMETTVDNIAVASVVGKEISQMPNNIIKEAQGLVSNIQEEIKNVGSAIETTAAATWCSVESWWNNTAVPVLLNVAMEYFQVTQRVNATVTTFVISLVEGLLQFVEALEDFVVLLLSAVGTVFTGLWDIGTAIFTDAELGDWSATSDLWDATMAYVSTQHVTDWFDNMYETTAFGQYLKENAYAFETTRSIGSGIGYIGGIVLLTIATFGVGGAATSGGAAAGSTATAATATTTTTTVAGLTSNQVMTMLATAAGTGRGTETAWVDGAGLLEGLAAGVATGLWEGLQFFTAGKIGNSKIFLPKDGAATLSQKILNSLFKVGADGIDGGLEGIAQPAIKLIYKDGSIDENGNFVEFSNDSNPLVNLWNNYCELFDDNGGWMAVATNATIGSAFSVFGEIFNLTRFINNGKNATGATTNIINESNISQNAVKNLDDQIALANYYTGKGNFYTISVDNIDDIPTDFWSKINNPENIIIKIDNQQYPYNEFFDLSNRDISALLESATINDHRNIWNKEALSNNLHQLFDNMYGYNRVQDVIDSINVIDSNNWRQFCSERGLGDNITGFVDSDSNLYLPSNASSHTAIHEAFHKISELQQLKVYDSNGNIRKVTGIREFYDDGFDSNMANETLTEYLSSKYGDGKVYSSMYGESNVYLWNRIDEAILQTNPDYDMLAYCYFNNNTTQLRIFFDTYCTKGTYDDFARYLQSWYSNGKILGEMVNSIELNVYKSNHPILGILKSIFGGK